MMVVVVVAVVVVVVVVVVAVLADDKLCEVAVPVAATFDTAPLKKRS